MTVVDIYDRKVVVKGAAKLHYEKGVPLTFIFDAAKDKGWEISILHLADEFWNNGWSYDRFRKKVMEEKGLDINNNIPNIDWDAVGMFFQNIEQPDRGDSEGYEKSREMLMESLFGTAENAQAWLEYQNKTRQLIEKLVGTF